jgi:predicted amidohydrolase
MESKVRIGSFQGYISENNFNANLDKVKSVLKETADMKLDFLCFPEAYLSGYTPKAIIESSVPIDHPELVDFVKSTKDYDTVILVGMSEKTDNGILNTELVIYKGELLGKANKTMLTSYDKKYYYTDLSIPVFEAKGVKFGIAICHTTSFVEPSLYLRWKGARLLFTPHFNSIRPDFFWEHRTMVLNNQSALATLLKMVVVRSNVIVIEKDSLGCGDSNIWNMHGELVAQGTPFKEGIVTYEFDKSIFQSEHWIDRREVPPELCKMIAEAAQKYNA